MQQRLRENSKSEAATAAELAQGLPRVLRQLRVIVKGLVPLELGADDFAPALQELVKRIEEQTGIPCRLDCHAVHPIRDSHTAVQLYRIAQEALTNAVKHGSPGHINVTYREEPSHVVLEIHDDGVGISDEFRERSRVRVPDYALPRPRRWRCPEYSTAARRWNHRSLSP